MATGKKMPETPNPRTIRSSEWYAEADEGEVLDGLLQVLWAARMWQIVREDPESELGMTQADADRLLVAALDAADHIPESGDFVVALFNDTFFKDREEA